MLMHIDQVINTSNYASPPQEQGRAGEKINVQVISEIRLRHCLKAACGRGAGEVGVKKMSA